MTRELAAGFYWVRLYQDADWEVANYHGDGRSWQVLGEDRCFDTEDLFEIGERVPERGRTFKLFEIVTTTIGESYVRSYAWCETAEQARAMFDEAGGGLGYMIAEITELFSADSKPFVSHPSDSGFSYTKYESEVGSDNSNP